MPRKVWLVEGWFGDMEWIEGVYSSEKKAQAKVDELWKTRKPENSFVPEWIHGHAKFAVQDYEVK